MQVSVIPADKTIIIDGAALQFDYVFFPPNLRAIQWNGASGAVEFSTGPQQWIDNYSFVQPYVDAYNAEKTRLEAEQAENA